MEAVNGVADGPPPPSPLTGCYLLVVLGEPHTGAHKDIILQRLAKGLLSWNLNDCLVDLEKELTIVTEQGLEGEEARYGERLIQFASENLVTEILIHPSVSTLAQCVRNLLSSFTRHRHIIHAGYTFAANGSWILQDGTFSLADFSEAFQEVDVQRVIRAYENGISFDIHCSPEGEWMRLPKDSFTRGCKLRVNPDDVLDSGSPAITNFVNYISPFLVPAELESTLESSDVVGNIRFSRPTLYVFPGGQGDAALFGINGFNMLVDGGFSRKACFWDFVRHLDRLDAVMLTRLNNSNANGIGAVLRRKAQNAVYPQVGHFFCNVQPRKANLSPDGDKDKDPLVVNLLEEGQDLISNLRSLELNPQLCYRDSEPINLYHKVGHGTLDMYVINPAKDSREVKEFLLRWNSNDQKLFANHKFSRECMLPLQNIVSICALLVWRPANPNDTITRILFPGSAPQSKIFEGLDRLKNLECIKHTVCTERTLAPPPKLKSKENILDKIEKPKMEVKKSKPRQQPENKLIEDSLKNGMQNGHSEKVVKKSGSVESDKSESKPAKTKREENKVAESNKQEKEKTQTKSRPETNGRVRQKPTEKKPSPPTPKRTVDSKKSELDKDTTNQRVRSKISPSATPAKSTKDATNRRVLESKSRTAPKRDTKESKQPEKKEETKKIERKPISRRPKADLKMPQSPVKRAINGVQKPDSLSRKGKLDRDVTTDSSTVSTPSVDQDNLKKDLSKLTPEEVQHLKAQELAELKEEQEAIKELEAVFRKGDKLSEESSDLRKIKDISIEDKTETDEYLIVEKEVIEPPQREESEADAKEEETVKLARDSEESEKKKDESDLDKDRQVDTEQEESGIGEQETEDAEENEISKEPSILSPEENKKIISKEDEGKEPAQESQPDEKVSANIESGATTTAPTLPEDERIPLNEIKEDIVDQIEEKHVKEETKEKETKEEIPVITFTTKTAENLAKIPTVVGIRLDKETRIRDIVKTPDEVADLPVHEEVDVEHLTEYAHERVKPFVDSPVKDEDLTSLRKSEESPKEDEVKEHTKEQIEEKDNEERVVECKLTEKQDISNDILEKSPLQEEVDVHVETTESKPHKEEGETKEDHSEELKSKEDLPEKELPMEKQHQKNEPTPEKLDDEKISQPETKQVSTLPPNIELTDKVDTKESTQKTEQKLIEVETKEISYEKMNAQDVSETKEKEKSEDKLKSLDEHKTPTVVEKDSKPEKELAMQEPEKIQSPPAENEKKPEVVEIEPKDVSAIQTDKSSADTDNKTPIVAKIHDHDGESTKISRTTSPVDEKEIEATVTDRKASITEKDASSPKMEKSRSPSSSKQETKLHESPERKSSVVGAHEPILSSETQKDMKSPENKMSLSQELEQQEKISLEKKLDKESVETTSLPSKQKEETESKKEEKATELSSELQEPLKKQDEVDEQKEEQPHKLSREVKEDVKEKETFLVKDDKPKEKEELVLEKQKEDSSPADVHKGTDEKDHAKQTSIPLQSEVEKAEKESGPEDLGSSELQVEEKKEEVADSVRKISISQEKGDSSKPSDTKDENKEAKKDAESGIKPDIIQSEEKPSEIEKSRSPSPLAKDAKTPERKPSTIDEAIKLEQTLDTVKIEKSRSPSPCEIKGKDVKTPERKSSTIEEPVKLEALEMEKSRSPSPSEIKGKDIKTPERKSSTIEEPVKIGALEMEKSRSPSPSEIKEKDAKTPERKASTIEEPVKLESPEVEKSRSASPSEIKGKDTKSPGRKASTIEEPVEIETLEIKKSRSPSPGESKVEDAKTPERKPSTSEEPVKLETLEKEISRSPSPSGVREKNAKTPERKASTIEEPAKLENTLVTSEIEKSRSPSPSEVKEKDAKTPEKRASRSDEPPSQEKALGTQIEKSRSPSPGESKEKDIHIPERKSSIVDEPEKVESATKPAEGKDISEDEKSTKVDEEALKSKLISSVEEKPAEKKESPSEAKEDALPERETKIEKSEVHEMIQAELEETKVKPTQTIDGTKSPERKISLSQLDEEKLTEDITKPEGLEKKSIDVQKSPERKDSVSDLKEPEIDKPKSAQVEEEKQKDTKQTTGDVKLPGDQSVGEIKTPDRRISIEEPLSSERKDSISKSSEKLIDDSISQKNHAAPSAEEAENKYISSTAAPTEKQDETKPKSEASKSPERKSSVIIAGDPQIESLHAKLVDTEKSPSVPESPERKLSVSDSNRQTSQVPSEHTSPVKVEEEEIPHSQAIGQIAVAKIPEKEKPIVSGERDVDEEKLPSTIKPEMTEEPSEEVQEMETVQDEKPDLTETINRSDELLSKKATPVQNNEKVAEDSNKKQDHPEKEAVMSKQPEEKLTTSHIGKEETAAEATAKFEEKFKKPEVVDTKTPKSTSPTPEISHEHSTEVHDRKSSIVDLKKESSEAPTAGIETEKETLIAKEKEKASIEKIESTESFLTRKFSVVHSDKEAVDQQDRRGSSPTAELKEKSPDSISSAETSTTVTTERETSQTAIKTERKESIHDTKAQRKESINEETRDHEAEPAFEEKFDTAKDSELDISKKVEDKTVTKEITSKDDMKLPADMEKSVEKILDKTLPKETTTHITTETNKLSELSEEKSERAVHEKEEKESTDKKDEKANEILKPEEEESLTDAKISDDFKAPAGTELSKKETELVEIPASSDKKVASTTKEETKSDSKSTTTEKAAEKHPDKESPTDVKKDIETTDEKADSFKDKAAEEKTTHHDVGQPNEKIDVLEHLDNKYASVTPEDAEESKDINLNREFLPKKEEETTESSTKADLSEDTEKIEIIEKQDHETAETEKGSMDKKLEEEDASHYIEKTSELKDIQEQKEKKPLADIHNFLEQEKLHSHKERGVTEEELSGQSNIVAAPGKSEDKPEKTEKESSKINSEDKSESEETHEKKTEAKKETEQIESEEYESDLKKEITQPKEEDDKFESATHREQIIKTEKIKIDLTDTPEHAESVLLKSTPDSPIINIVPVLPVLPTDIDKAELGRKSPKEREEDVAKIVASVATVLKSDAPLEVFHKQRPLYTTELRETHITTCDSPVDEKDLNRDFQHRKISEEKELEFMKALESSIIADKKGDAAKESLKTEETETDEPGTVHRMLVTASSEDGGEETEICPAGTIIFSRSSESSGRSSPENLSRKLSQTSSILDTISDQTTVKELQDVQAKKEPIVEEISKSTKGVLEGAVKSESSVYPGMDLNEEVKSLAHQIEDAIKADKMTEDEEKEHGKSEKQASYPGINLKEEMESLEDQIEEAVKVDKKEDKRSDDKPSEIKDILSEAIQEVSKDAEDIKESVTGKIGNVFGSIFSSASKVSEALSHTITDSVKAVETSIDEGLKKVETEIDEVKHKIEDVETKVVDKIVEKKEKAEHIVADHLKESVSALTEAIDKTDKAKESLVKQTEDTLDKMAGPLRETLGDALSNLAESIEKSKGDKKDEQVESTKTVKQETENKKTVTIIPGATEDEIKNWIDQSGGEVTKQIYPSLKDDLKGSADKVEETIHQAQAGQQNIVDIEWKKPLSDIKDSISSVIGDATQDIEEALSKVETASKESEKKVDEGISDLKETITSTIGEVSQKKDEIIEKKEEISKDVDGKIGSSIEATSDGLSNMIAESKNVVKDELNDVEKSIAEKSEKKFDTLKDNVKNVLDESEDIAQSIEAKTVNGLSEIITESKDQIEDFMNETKKTGVKEIENIRKETDSHLDALKTTKEDISAKISDSKETVKEISDSLSDVTEVLKEEAKDVTQKAEATLDTAEKDLQQAGDTLKHETESALKDLMGDVKSSAEIVSGDVCSLIGKTLQSIPKTGEIQKEETSATDDKDSLLSELETRADNMISSYTEEIKDTLKDSTGSIEDDAKLSFETIKNDLEDLKKDSAKAVDDEAKTAQSAISDISSIVKEEIDNSLKGLAGAEESLTKQISDTSSNVVDSLKSAAETGQTLKKESKSAIKDIGSTIAVKSDELVEKSKQEIEKKVSDLKTEVEGTKTAIIEKAESVSKDIKDTKDQVEGALSETKESIESSITNIKQDLEKEKEAIVTAGKELESEVKHAVEDVFDAGKKLFGGLFGSKKSKEDKKTVEAEKKSTESFDSKDIKEKSIQNENRVTSEISGLDKHSSLEESGKKYEVVDKNKCDVTGTLGLGKSGDISEICDISKGDVQTHLGLAVSQEKKLSISDVEIFVDDKGKDSSMKCDLKTVGKDQKDDRGKEEVIGKLESSDSCKLSSHKPEIDKHITDVPSRELPSKAGIPSMSPVLQGQKTTITSEKFSDSEDDFDPHKMSERMDPMTMSFYGALPDDDVDDLMDDGEDLSGRSEVPSTLLHDITKAKFESKQLGGSSKFPVQDPMTSSFYGELPGEKDEKDPIEAWGKPLGLPSPAPPNEKGTPKKERKLPSNVMAKNRINDDRQRSESPSKNKKKINPVYVDLTYVPHHGNSNYAYVDFFKRVRARYYVFSGIEPSREVYNALLEAKQTWEDKDLEVTIIPTYDTDVLGYWVAENEELLTKYKIDLSPSASRCTINLQDHETSCSAYRLEF